MLTLQLTINGLVEGCLYALTGLGLTIIFGVLKIANFAHGQFYMIGATAAYVVSAKTGLGYVAALPIAVGAGLAIGLLSELIVVRPLLRAPEESIFLSTFALSLVLIYGVELALGSATHSVASPLTGSLRAGDVVVPTQEILVVGATLAVIAVVQTVVYRSRAGLVMRAVMQDRDVARLNGIRVGWVYVAAFAGAAALASLAGALVAPLTGVNPFTGQNVLIKAFIVVIVGGMESIPGAVVVGLAIGIAESITSRYAGSVLRDYVPYILAALVLVARPQGLLGRATVRMS